MGARSATLQGVEWVGTVRALFLAPMAGAAMEAHQEVTVVEAVGVTGDRYAAGQGRFSRSGRPRSGEDLTLVEEEAIDAVRRDYGIDLELGATRRNVVCRGVPLNHLVGKTFRVGPAVVRGVRLAEPCNHLVKLTGVPKLRQALLHRGGLRADVVSGGRIRVGDRIEPVGGA